MMLTKTRKLFNTVLVNLIFKFLNNCLGDYFANRTWKGLDDQYQENTDTILRHGLEGIASGYITEK